MTFNNDWNRVYATKQMAQYPDTALVRFVARNYYSAPDRKRVKFLDVGCGVGASTWYLAREGFNVASIDGSLVAINRLKKRLEDDRLEAFLMCADLLSMSLLTGFFDCIVDVSTLCYVGEDEIENVMKQLHKVLKPGGKFFSIGPSTACDKDPFVHTIDGVELKARFIGINELEDLFKDFNEVNIGHYSYGFAPNEIIDLYQVHAVK